jgi:hypothetical protein
MIRFLFFLLLGFFLIGLVVAIWPLLMVAGLIWFAWRMTHRRSTA